MATISTDGFRQLADLSEGERHAVRRLFDGHPVFQLYLEAGLASVSGGDRSRTILVGRKGIGAALGIEFDDVTVRTIVGSLDPDELVVACSVDRSAELHVAALGVGVREERKEPGGPEVDVDGYLKPRAPSYSLLAWGAQSRVWQRVGACDGAGGGGSPAGDRCAKARHGTHQAPCGARQRGGWRWCTARGAAREVPSRGLRAGRRLS